MHHMLDSDIWAVSTAKRVSFHKYVYTIDIVLQHNLMLKTKGEKAEFLIAQIALIVC